MRMKKSIKLLATTTASSLIVTMTTGCGVDERKAEPINENHTQDAESPNEGKGEKFNFKISKIEGSVDITRCGIKCVMTEK